MPNPSDFAPGAQWLAKATPRNVKNGVQAESRVWITIVTGEKVSIYVDKGGLKLFLDKQTLVGNFTKEFAMMPNRAYVGSLHATKAYV